jgi:hypothetical protein
MKEMPGTTGFLQERRNYRKSKRQNGMQTQECRKEKPVTMMARTD